ncbi:MAG: hypothetical protein LBV29_03365 [Azoarcus sp.]|jgi:hypothetical protein|nr:hypothetical protein [Azoarcus sp.]
MVGTLRFANPATAIQGEIMGLVAYEKLIETLHKSVIKANALYEAWSGSWLITSATESFLVSQMATAIMKLNNPPSYLTLETLFQEISDNQGKNIRGRKPSYYSDQNRLDMALYSGENLSHAIEVKRFMSPKCINDIARLCKLHENFHKKIGGTFQHCIFVQYVYAKARKRGELCQHLENKLNEYKEKCAAFIEERGLTYEFRRGGEFVKPITYNDEICSSYSITIKS